MIKVLIVDDSIAFRVFLRKCLALESDIEVVGRARDGIDALEQIKDAKPDAVTLDMNMPRMDGMETLKEIRRLYPKIVVVMVASETEDDASRTVKALQEGAFDFILKPTASVTNPLENLRVELTTRLREAFRGRPDGITSGSIVGRKDGRNTTASGAVQPRVKLPVADVHYSFRTPPAVFRPSILAIGSSTGGPAALGILVSSFTKPFNIPVVIVQHMPPLFVHSLAKSLSAKMVMPCTVPVDGEVLENGHVYIAPGGVHTDILINDVGKFCVRLHESPPVHFCRPAVDVMFKSLVHLAPKVKTLAVVLTGMGRDGADGAADLADHGGFVIAQDEASSVVWGMPGATVKGGAAHEMYPLDQIGPLLVKRIQ
ncbi:MAG: chemotaxis-specific protein-glutamate methyltransferase CheB [Zetaproteobacteria bacterium]|nr:chemotaxis-specific protein-glutamate methyltransferase CheB [Zetaproteobacteria bacterium]